MPLQSTLTKLLIGILSVTVFLLIVDFLLFQSQNAITLLTAILTSYTQNPIWSGGVTLLLLSLAILVGGAMIRRRRGFLIRLRTQLNEAERITLLELARSLDVTPAKVEVELKRMDRSSIRPLSGLLIVSQGKAVYIGEKLTLRIIESYQQDLSRGEIAGALQIPRGDLDKVINQLIHRGIIDEREEKQPTKVRPSYRRGTR